MKNLRLELGCTGCGAIAVLPARTPKIECGYCGTILESAARARARILAVRRKKYMWTYVGVQLGALAISTTGLIASTVGSLVAVVAALGGLVGFMYGLMWLLGY